MSGPAPATRHRSPWVLQSDLSDNAAMPALGVTHWSIHDRNVHDGQLHAIVAEEPLGWHMSISHPKRYPTWDEITHARYQLLPGDIDFVMHLPPPDEYVALHDNCFHLHEHPEREVRP